MSGITQNLSERLSALWILIWFCSAFFGVTRCGSRWRWSTLSSPATHFLYCQGTHTEPHARARARARARKWSNERRGVTRQKVVYQTTGFYFFSVIKWKVTDVVKGKFFKLKLGKCWNVLFGECASMKYGVNAFLFSFYFIFYITPVSVKHHHQTFCWCTDTTRLSGKSWQAPIYAAWVHFWQEIDCILFVGFHYSSISLVKYMRISGLHIDILYHVPLCLFIYSISVILQVMHDFDLIFAAPQ